MEELTEIAQSLSPYIVMLVVHRGNIDGLGDRTPMPHVWVTRPTSEIIVNIWDYDGTSKIRALMMVPNGYVDHTIILSPQHTGQLKDLITEFTSVNTSLTVITNNKEEQTMCRTQGINFTTTNLTDYINEVAKDIYQSRVKEVNSKIAAMLKD